MNYKTVVGYLRVTLNAKFDELFECSETHYFELENGLEFIELHFETEEQYRLTPPNEKIALSVSVEPDEHGHYDVSSEEPYFTRVYSAVGEPIVLKRHVGIWKRISPDSTDTQVRDAQFRVDRTALRVEDFFRQQDVHNTWDIQARGYVFKGTDETHPTKPPYYGGNGIREYMENNDMEGFEPNYLHVVGGSSPGFCGQGDLGGPRSVTYSESSTACDDFTTLHELGHNFGMHHAGTRDETGFVKEYGDMTDLMASHSGKGLNSPHRLQMGLESPREIKVVSSTEQVLLCPLEMSELGLHPNEHQTVLVQGDRRSPSYYISIRKAKGYYSQGSSTEQIVYVHTFNPYNKYDKPLRELPDLKVGDSKLLANGVTVDYLEYNNETARVNILFPVENPKPEDTPPNLIMHEGFPVPLEETEVKEEYAGGWYNASQDGQGFDIFVKDGIMGIYWYTYNMSERLTPARRFYLGSCPVGESTKEFDLYTTEGGTFEDPTKAKEVKVGTAQLYFLDEKNGVFNYNLNFSGRGSIPITPVATSTDPRNGVFYQPDRNGEGFGIKIYDKQNTISAYWYTYGEPDRGGRYDAPLYGTEQRWYLCDGRLRDEDSVDYDGVYTLDILEFTGGKWNSTNPSAMDIVGQAVLRYNLDGSIDFDYTFNDGTVGSYKLLRLL